MLRCVMRKYSGWELETLFEKLDSLRVKVDW